MIGKTKTRVMQEEERQYTCTAYAEGTANVYFSFQ
jgi:hypothetical protein